MIWLTVVERGGRTICCGLPSRLCIWLIASLTLAAAETTRSDLSARDPFLPPVLLDQSADEQCLCNIAAYALFYSKVFGRHTCGSGGTDVGRRSDRQLHLSSTGAAPTASGKPRQGTSCSAGNGSRLASAAGAAPASAHCGPLSGLPSRPRSSAPALAALDPAPLRAPALTAPGPPAGALGEMPGCCLSGLHNPAAATPAASHPQPAAEPSSASPAGAGAGAGAGDDHDPDGRLIVRFDHYAPAEEHRAVLGRVLGPEGPDSWTWLPRTNAAARFPTDFALLAASPARQAGLRARLLAATSAAAAAGAAAAITAAAAAASGPAAGGGIGVRDVHSDRRYTGRLSWAAEGPLRDIVLDLNGGGGAAAAAGDAAAAAASGAAGGVLDGPDMRVFSVSSRRPGRMATRFSAEALDGDGGPEATRDVAAQQAWRTPRPPGSEASEAGMDLGLGLDPASELWAEQMDVAEQLEGREGHGEGSGGGGGLTGSRRRVAAVEADGGSDGSEGGREQPIEHGHTYGHAHEHAHEHAHGAHQQHQQHIHHQHLHHPLHRRKRHKDHFDPKFHENAGGDAAAGAAVDGAAAAAATAATRRTAAAAVPHTGRMGGNLGLGIGDGDGGGGGERERWRRRLHLSAGGGTVPVMLQADKLWEQGYTGKGVKVGIFDTGIRRGHPHIRNIRERTNWTHQDSLSDGLGHGSFVAGVVGGQDTQCPGFAPDVDLYTFKVFTDDQVSYTSWFLDAFNYAMIVQVNVINLSIGGPDYLDQPFVDKVLEVTSNGILLISAIGNDGPLYGTLNNPADQNDVIGVGGIDNWDNIASFSSRGMSTWELPRGYGRVKPDVMAYSKDVQGSKIEGGCRSLSGTSVASPVVAGAVSLLASTVPLERRWELLNPASMKQALVEGAVRLNNLNIYEQGSGRINLPNSMAILQSYKPRASVIPAKLDLTDCPYMWPFCRQHLYAGSLPVLFNATLLNGQGVVGWLEGPPVWRPSDGGGELLHLTFEWSERLWPWSGFLALYIRVRAAGADYDGLANGVVEATVVSAPAPGEAAPRRSKVSLPLRARISPPPPRSRRLLWDQFHSLKYPPAYLPRDNLDVKSDILDWHGDHPHTNFHGLFNALRDKGYFLEVLGSPATCFDPSQYAALLVVDSEEEWYPAEVAALEEAVSKLGLNLLVFADWYNLASLDQMRFFDDNTRSWWNPATGGANVPALNDMLAPYGLALGDAVVHGTVNLAGMRLVVSFGSDIAVVPQGGWLHKASLTHAVRRGGSTTGHHAYLAGVAHGSAGGHVVVFSDSNCLDRSHMSHNCYDLVMKLLARLEEGEGAAGGLLDAGAKLSKPYTTSLYNFSMPVRRPASEYNFTEVSYVLSHPTPACFPNSACEKQAHDPSCRALLAADNETLARRAAATAAAEGRQAPRGKGVGAVTDTVDGGSTGRGSGTVLLVHPDGTAPSGTKPLLLGLSGLQLLVLGCLLLMGLFLAVWVMRMGTGRGPAGLGGFGGGPGGDLSGGAAGGGGPSMVGLTAARRDRLRLRANDV